MITGHIQLQPIHKDKSLTHLLDLEVLKTPLSQLLCVTFKIAANCFSIFEVMTK